jgi:hypothetical protein
MLLLVALQPTGFPLGVPMSGRAATVRQFSVWFRGHAGRLLHRLTGPGSDIRLGLGCDGRPGTTIRLWFTVEIPRPPRHVFQSSWGQPLQHLEGDGAKHVGGKGAVVFADWLLDDSEAGALGQLIPGIRSAPVAGGFSSFHPVFTRRPTPAAGGTELHAIHIGEPRRSRAALDGLGLRGSSRGSFIA